MVVTKRVTNPDVVKAVMSEVWDTALDDTVMDFADYEPIIDDDNVWIASYLDHDLVGMFYIHRLNLITWQLHMQIRPSHRGQGITIKHCKALMDATWEETGCKKIYATVPEYAKPLLAIAKRVGFKQEGRMKKSYQKDGEIVDQINLGVYR